MGTAFAHVPLSWQSYSAVQLQELIQQVKMRPKDADKLHKMLGADDLSKPSEIAVPNQLRALLDHDNWRDVESQIKNITKMGAEPRQPGAVHVRAPAQDVHGGSPTLTATAFVKHRVGADIIKDIKADGIRPGMCGAQMIREVTLGRDRNKREAAAFTMFEAVSKGNLDAVRKLIDNSETVDTRDDKGQTPLIVAATFGYYTIMEELLNANAAPNAVRNGNRTALMMCAEKGHHICVTLLLQHAANINHRDDSTATALVLAVTRGHNESVSVLLKGRAHIEATDNLGRTSLMLAAFLGHKYCLDVLIEHGANVNAKVEGDDRSGIGADKSDRMTVASTRGRTAFHWACFAGQLECVKALIAAGCNTSVIDNEKKTGHDLAMSKMPRPSTGSKSGKPKGKGKSSDRRDQSGKSSGPHLAVVRFLDQRSIEASEELLKTESTNPVNAAGSTSTSKKERQKRKKKERQKKLQEENGAPAMASRCDSFARKEADADTAKKNLLGDERQSTKYLDATVSRREENPKVKKGQHSSNDDGPSEIVAKLGILIESLRSQNNDLATAFRVKIDEALAETPQLAVSSSVTHPRKEDSSMSSEHEQLLTAWDAKYAALKKEKEGLEKQLEQQQIECSVRIEEAWQGSNDEAQLAHKMRMERDTVRAELIEMTRRVRRLETTVKEKDTNIADVLFQLTTTKQDGENIRLAYNSRYRERSDHEKQSALELQRARAEAQKLAENLDHERTQITLERQQFRSEMQAVQRGRFEIEQRLSQREHLLHGLQTTGRPLSSFEAPALTVTDRKRKVGKDFTHLR